jgi:rare lipoprotein A
LLATLLAMAGAITDLGRGESVAPRRFHRAPDRSSELGVASWYGHPYHGRRAANGARYDMNRLTAAHRFLPFGTRVRVQNLRNARTVEVEITDRGPFVEGRLIDLSRAAADVLGFQRAGLASVRLDVLAGAAAADSLE